MVRKGVGAAKRVALTFDDGPDDTTDQYLEVLQRFGAQATFFVVGAPASRAGTLCCAWWPMATKSPDMASPTIPSPR